MATDTMKPLSPDTPLEVERVWLAEILLRALYGDEVDARKVVELRRQLGFYDPQP